MQTLNKVLIILFVSATFSAITSCKKNDIGGKAEIHAKILHGTTPIVASTLYVKFDTTAQPTNPTTDYDLKVEGEMDDNHVHIEELRQGEYFLYVEGFDSLAMQKVHGGMATSIKWGERKKTKEVEIQTTN